MSYDNILFDLYGTLIDLHTNETKAVLWQNMARLYSMYGAGYEASEFRKRFRLLRRSEEERLLPIMREKYHDPDMGLEDIEPDLDVVFKIMFREKGVEADDQLIAHLAATFRSVSISYIKLFDGTLPLLSRLKEAGKRVYLVSNAQASFTRPELISQGLYDKFDGILLSSDIGVKKPSRHIFETAFDEFGIERSKTVMVGNDYCSDVIGARAASLPSIQVMTGQEGVCAFDGDIHSDCIRIQRIEETADIVI